MQHLYTGHYLLELTGYTKQNPFENCEVVEKPTLKTQWRIGTECKAAIATHGYVHVFTNGKKYKYS